VTFGYEFGGTVRALGEVVTDLTGGFDKFINNNEEHVKILVNPNE
jgi:hypothetical protein